MAYIQYAQVKQEIGAIVAERPDFIYQPPEPGHCIYKEGTTPSCLIGYWLFRHHPDLFAKIDSGTNGSAIHTLLLDWSDMILVSEQAEAFLIEVQETQDRGRRWQFAYERACEEAEDPTHQLDD